MTRRDLHLVLTRPEPQSLSFLADVETRLGYAPDTVLSPILRIVATGAKVDLDRYRTLIVTSGNSVAVMSDSLAGRLVVTVGERTAELAEASGAYATCFGATVDELMDRVREIEAPAAHLRGTHGRGDLADRAHAMGIALDEHVVYDQVEQEMSDRAQAVLAEGRAVLPVFSPRSAALISQYRCHPDVNVIAMSPAVADAWTAGGHVSIAERPDRPAMLDMVEAAF